MRVKNRVEADKDKVSVNNAEACKSINRLLSLTVPPVCAVQVIVVNPAFFKYTHDNWTEHHGRYPSTGIVAIIFALHLCDEVCISIYSQDNHFCITRCFQSWCSIPTGVSVWIWGGRTRTLAPLLGAQQIRRCLSKNWRPQRGFRNRGHSEA